MRRCLLFPLTILILFQVQAQSIKDNNLYVGQKPPGLVPEVFAPNLISQPDRYEFGSVFSKDGKEFYLGIDTGPKNEIHFSQYKDGEWTPMEVLIAHESYGFNDPMLSMDEQRLYFISNLPRNESDTIKDIDIWYVERESKGWSEPMNAGEEINTDKNEYYISFNEQGDMFFSTNLGEGEGRMSNYDIHRSEVKDGVFQIKERLSESINTRAYEADVFVAPDESYLIFCSVRRGGYGRGDLYISFKQADGSWSQAKNMGDGINDDGHQFCPFVTWDGKYLLYTSKQDIYWVSMEVIEELRKN